MFKRTLTAVALATGLVVSGATTGEAKGPEEKFRIDEQFSETDGFLSELCGFEVNFALDTRGWVRLWDNGRVLVTEHGSFVLTNVENGKTLTNEWRGAYRGQSTETVEDGILTIEFRDVNVGIPERWRDHNGKVLIFDRGRAAFEGKVIIDLVDPEDPEDDEVLHFHEEVTVNGPHPILEQGFLDPSQACEALA